MVPSYLPVGILFAKGKSSPDWRSSSWPTNRTMVKDPQGRDLGTITDIVTGPEGRAAFAVLSYWISDDTQMRVAVPFGALCCEEQNCVLSESKDALESAPTFVSEDDLAEPKMAEDIYRYFGVQPYWTEE